MRSLPGDFTVPDRVAVGDFVLQLLTMDDAPYDYEAYMSSIARLQGVLGPGHNTWPTRNIDYRFAIASVGYCEWEHCKGTSYHYGIFARSGGKQFGRVSVAPGFCDCHDVQVVYWVRDFDLRDQLEIDLLAFLTDWMARTWSFSNPGFPGRTHSWDLCAAPRFLPEHFSAPKTAAGAGFVVRQMRMDDYVLDYQAYMSSFDAIAAVYDPAAGWPRPDLTLRDALVALGAVEWEHYHELLFSYCVMNEDESRQIGCIYLAPTRNPGFDAEFSYWVTQAEAENGFGPELVAWARKWLETEWPFESVGYPGIECTWMDWISARDA